MTIVESAPRDLPGDVLALIEEAKRHRRRRRWFTATVVLLVPAISLGVFAVVSWNRSSGHPNGAGQVSSSRLVGLLPHNDAYEACPGSARVGPETAPDGLPAKGSRTNNVAFVTFVAKNMDHGRYLGFTHRVVGLPDRGSVIAIRVGPGGGYVWKRISSHRVGVVHVKNYGIYVYLRMASQCPHGGWVRMSDDGVQVTFLAPKI
jgi:hypothetical protein